MTKKKINKKIFSLIAALTLLGLGYLYIVSLKPFDLTRKATNPQTAVLAFEDGSKEKFDYLSDQTSNSCGLQANVLLSYADDKHLQGSCCNPMSLHRYEEQVEGLKDYSNIPQIPKDPYDIPVSLAKELLQYKGDIQLTADQQKTYDQAMKMSHEGGPCCCKCWRWDAFEGQAKYLITKHNFDAQQIANVWDIEDGCGGDLHQHGQEG